MAIKNIANAFEKRIAQDAERSMEDAIGDIPAMIERHKLERELEHERKVTRYYIYFGLVVYIMAVGFTAYYSAIYAADKITSYIFIH